MSLSPSSSKASKKPDKGKKPANKSAERMWTRVQHEAAEHFGIKRFRPGQRKIIEAVLNGRDVLGVMPTGAGKSLTYQIPALILEGPVLVVSPLIALMEDQEEKADESDIAVVKLNSTLTKTEEKDTKQEIKSGAHDVVLVTPDGEPGIPGPA